MTQALFSGLEIVGAHTAYFFLCICRKNIDP